MPSSNMHMQFHKYHLTMIVPITSHYQTVLILNYKVRWEDSPSLDIVGKAAMKGEKDAPAPWFVLNL